MKPSANAAAGIFWAIIAFGPNPPSWPGGGTISSTRCIRCRSPLGAKDSRGSVFRSNSPPPHSVSPVKVICCQVPPPLKLIEATLSLAPPLDQRSCWYRPATTSPTMESRSPSTGLTSTQGSTSLLGNSSGTGWSVEPVPGVALQGGEARGLRPDAATGAITKDPGPAAAGPTTNATNMTKALAKARPRIADLLLLVGLEVDICEGAPFQPRASCRALFAL